MIKWYKKSWSEIVKQLDSNSYYGLYDEQVEDHRKKYGTNNIVMPEVKSLLNIVFTQFREFWILFLFLCFLVLTYFKLFLLSGILICIILINSICVALNQYKDENNIKELKKLNMGYARVIRNGRTMKIPSEDIVVGDIVIVGTGEAVNADMRIIECNDLKVDESSVTGEKYLVDKYEAKIEDDEIGLSDMKNMLFKSSVVVKGDVTAIVVAVGMDTQVAEIMKLLLKENKMVGSFKESLNEILNMYSKILISVSLIGLLLKYNLKGNIEDFIINPIVLYLSCFPIGFCVILWFINNILLDKLKKHNINFKNIFSVEKFSKVSAICTNKIGAFSKKRVDIVKAYGSGEFIDIYEQDPNGDMNENLFRMLNIGVLCSDIKSDYENIDESKNDLVDASIIRFAQEKGIYKRKIQGKYRKLFQISFDTERRIITTVNKVNNKYRANVKGAVDSILERCTHILKNGVELEITEDDINSIRNADINMSNESLNVVGFAYRNFNYEPSQNENIESNLVFVGLIGFENKLNETAEISIKKAYALSIKPIIITDDGKLTALAVGKKLGIVKKLQQILSGVEIDNMENEEFKRIGEKINIFSRINSKHKIQIIQALKDYGYMTAITGYRLTDIPALNMANVGITNSESNIVKKLSDIFVSDIDFMKMLNLVEDCRRIINVLRKMVIYILTCSFGILSFLFINMCSGINLDSIQNMFLKTVWINVALMSLSSLALVNQYKDENTEYNNYSFGKDMVKDRLSFIIFNGFLIGLLGFISFKTASFFGCNFSSSVLSIVLNLYFAIFILSFTNRKLFKGKIPNVILAVNIILQILIVPLIDGFMIINDFNYWLTTIIFTLPWFVFCVFHKLDMENYYKY
jgi:P-type Ca2+ transporter type 2C